MNQLQPLPIQTPVLVTLNATRAPQPGTVLNEMHYSHPIFDGPAVNAQRLIPEIQGEGGVWLAGAWTRYGFHEDGFQSGITAAQDIRNKLAPLLTQTDYAQAA
jgi:predicted NAD/FAD-binding protein